MTPPDSAPDPHKDFASVLAATLPDGPHRMTVGLRPLPLAQWIDDGADFDDQLRERSKLLQNRDDVLAALPGSEGAQRELLGLLVAHVREHFPARYHFNDEAAQVTIAATGECIDLHSDNALANAARLVPEDLCLMQAADDQAASAAQYRLTAAALCFPTRWRLVDKLGHALLDIHAPVPGYAQHVGAASDRVLASLTSARPLWRHNWSLLDAPELYQPTRVELEHALTTDEIGERLWFRSERQTLRRLPQSNAVLFTIRVRQCTLASLCDEPDAARRLHEQMSTLPAALLAYKGLNHIEALLLDYLLTRSGGSIGR